MNESIKRNWPLLLAFSLPAVLIFGVAISSYLPGLFMSTGYNFVYSTCSNSTSYYNDYYYCEKYLRDRISVADSRVVINEIDASQDTDKDGTPDIKEYVPHFFLHDTNKNESREISFDEVKALSLNGLVTSPDGVTVQGIYDRGADFLFFRSDSDRGQYLTKGRAKSKLNLISQNDDYYYRYNFRFVGWILPGRN